MRTLIVTGFVLSGVLLLSCKIGKERSKNKDLSQYPSAILAETMDAYRESASVTITSVDVNGDLMSMGVEYSGGCEKHDFQLVGSTMLQKSMPPKRGVILYHNNKGDACRGIVNDTLEFNIAPLAYEGGEVILNITGWEQPVSYTKSK